MIATKAGRPIANAASAIAVAGVSEAVKAPRSNSTMMIGSGTTISATAAGRVKPRSSRFAMIWNSADMMRRLPAAPRASSGRLPGDAGAKSMVGDALDCGSAKLPSWEGCR